MKASPIVSFALLPPERSPPPLLVRATARELDPAEPLLLLVFLAALSDPLLLVAFLAITVSCLEFV
jgi:hypothetical protein